jgi:serine protease AprX
MHVGSGRVLRTLAALAILMATAPTTATIAAHRHVPKLDSQLQQKVTVPGRSQVLVRLTGATAVRTVRAGSTLLGGRVVRALPVSQSVVLDVPNSALPALAASPQVDRVSSDRSVFGVADTEQAPPPPPPHAPLPLAGPAPAGFDGTGVGVALIDSGAFATHPDLADPSTGASRVVQFVDFVNGQTTAYDDYGHGTHVAGIIAGNGADSGGAYAGVAPGARLIVLKVLDARGRGRVSDVIAALDYVVANKDALNIRVVNLSVAAGVYESYTTDPITLAAKRAVDAGLVVVAAAGNNGRGIAGQAAYAGISAPGNAPWVLTVGASNDMGTADLHDDTIAAFSSRGPGAIDNGAKPDLVAPGVAVTSLADPASLFYVTQGASLLSGTANSAFLPYLRLSGTSIATPFVSGTAALMLQANPSLTPNAVKAILQYTTFNNHVYDTLTQGAGSLKTASAVELAAALAGGPAPPPGDSKDWSRSVIWGNYETSGGNLIQTANAFAPGLVWGVSTALDGQTIVLGQKAKKPWQVFDALGPQVNVVWGDLCGGADCTFVWTARDVFAASDPEADTVVWGSTDGEGDTVVWGSVCTDPWCTSTTPARR